MGQYTLQSMANSIATSLRVSSDTARLAEIKSILREELTSIWYSKPWTFARGYTEVQTSPSLALTISTAAANSTAVSTDGSPSVSAVDATTGIANVLERDWIYYAVADTSQADFPHEVDTVTGTQTIALTQKYTGDADPATATRVRDMYSLPNDFFQPRVVVDPGRAADITWYGEEQFKHKYPYPTTTEADPHSATLVWEVETANTYYIGLRIYPVPSTEGLLPIYYHRVLNTSAVTVNSVTGLSDTDTIPIPDIVEIYLLYQGLYTGSLRIRQDPVMAQSYAPILQEKRLQAIAAFSNYQEQLMFEHDGMGRHQKETLLPS